MTRKFEAKPAVRERIPMLVGLTGASGSGKTYSALRLATGMQRVTGGEIYFIDTEARRALQYSDEFKFKHVAMEEPFSPTDYLEAIEFCRNAGAKIIIVDSMSHEHSGPGGVLEMHDAELDRLAGNDYGKRARMTMLAWAKPKAERRKLIDAILRMGVNAIFCFRAKPKLKLVKGGDPIPLGWQPVAGEEFVFEQTINCLLYPNSGGIPTWSPDEKGEAVMLKRPENLRSVFRDGQPLSEETGAGLAQWAEGEVVVKGLPKETFAAGDEPDVRDVSLKMAITALTNAPDEKSLKRTADELAQQPWVEEAKAQLKKAMLRRRKELREGVEIDEETGEIVPPARDEVGDGGEG